MAPFRPAGRSSSVRQPCGPRPLSRRVPPAPALGEAVRVGGPRSHRWPRRRPDMQARLSHRDHLGAAHTDSVGVSVPEGCRHAGCGGRHRPRAGAARRQGARRRAAPTRRRRLSTEVAEAAKNGGNRTGADGSARPSHPLRGRYGGRSSHGKVSGPAPGARPSTRTMAKAAPRPSGAVARMV